MKTRSSISRAFFGTLALLAALQGCGDDDNDNPTPPDDVTPVAGTKTGGSGGKSGSGDAGETSTGGTSKGGTKNNGGTGNDGTGNTGNEGGGENVVGGAGAGPGPIPVPECDLPELGDDGCFNCPEDGEAEQWLNRCVDSDCEPFDNSATRLPLLEADGSLPPLPS